MNIAKTFLGAAVLSMGLLGIAQAQGHGHGGAHGGMGIMGGIFNPEAQAKLQLTSEQAQQLEGIRARMKELRQGMRQEGQQFRQAMQAEMAKPAPDLAHLAQLREQMFNKRHQGMQAIQNDALALYAGMSPQQKGVVKQLMQERMARWDDKRKTHKHQASVPPAS